MLFKMQAIEVLIEATGEVWLFFYVTQFNSDKISCQCRGK